MGWTLAESFIGIGFVTVVFALSSGTKRHFIPEVDSTSFVFLQYTTASVIGLMMWLIAGYPTLSNLDSTQYAKAICIFLGGFVCLVVDFLIFAAIRHFNSFVVMGTYLVLSSPLGVILNYFIDDEDINPGYLFGGTALAFVGLLFVLASNYLLEEHRVLRKYPNSEEHGESAQLLHRDDEVQPTSQSQVLGTRTQQQKDELSQKVFWFWLLIITGVLGCSWSVLPAYGDSGTDGITEISLVILIFFIGCVAAMPTCVFVFCHLEMFGANVVDYQGVVPMFQRLCSYNWYQLSVSVLIGCVYGCAYVCYFYSTVSSDLPTAASMALYMSAIVITSLACIFIFGDYVDVHFYSWPIFYLVVGMLLYAAAIFTIVSYSIVY